MKKFAVATIAAMAIAPFALAGGSWDETADGGGDAGQLHTTAQVVSGSGNLATITGSLDGTDNDAYMIFLPDPTTIFIDTFGSAFDTQLFFFRADGTGLVENDDFSGLDSAITGTAGTELGLPAGNYIIAISSFNNDPVDAGGAQIFGFDNYGDGSDFQRMPDDPNAVVADWDGGSNDGAYTIHLTGAEFVPAPAALALLGVAGLLGRRRRRA